MTSRREPWSFLRPSRVRAALAWGALIAVAGLAPGVDGRARASIMVALDLPTLVQQADHIAVVEVGSVQAAWDQNHERIFSTIDLKVIETWKSPSASGVATGSPASPGAVGHLTVVQPGGTVGDIRMTVMGMGVFAPGERSLVFLRGPANHAQVVGMTQGKRSVRYESTAGAWMVAPPDLRQAKLVHPLPGQGISAKGLVSPPASPVQSALPAAAAGSNLPLDDLRTEIKRLLGASRP